MRRWRVVVIDDNPEGSLEAALLSPLVIATPLSSDASEGEVRCAIEDNLLDRFLPLPSGEPYACQADIDFRIRDFATRRKECGPRMPMIEIERDFARAWHLMTELAKDPPDIIFLDVMFDIKTTKLQDIEAIIDELQPGGSSIDERARPTPLEILGRGGLYLLGKLLRSRGQLHRMPLIVLYSASRDVHTDFRPFEYASDGRFEVVDKLTLKTSAQKRREVFRRRIRDFFLDGTVRAEDVRTAVSLLGSSDAIAEDVKTVTRALKHDVGSGWCFGSLFASESVEYLSREPSERLAVVDELERFIAPLVGDARSFVDFLALSPARLFSHMPGVFVTYSHRPSWVDGDHGAFVNGTERFRMLLSDFGSDEIEDISTVLDEAVSKLPESLRELLTAELETMGAVPKISSLEISLAEARRRRLAKLGSFVRKLRKHSEYWEWLIDRCRMRTPVASIAGLINERARSSAVSVDGITDRILRGSLDKEQKLELFLSPSNASVKEPLSPLLTAIIDSGRNHARNPGRIHVSFAATKTPCAAVQVEICDAGSEFTDLRYYDPHGRGGDLSTALVAAASWFEVEIHSGGVKARPAASGAGKIEESDVTDGTLFVLRLPAFHIEEEQ